MASMPFGLKLKNKAALISHLKLARRHPASGGGILSRSQVSAGVTGEVSGE